LLLQLRRGSYEHARALGGRRAASGGGKSQCAGTLRCATGGKELRAFKHGGHTSASRTPTARAPRRPRTRARARDSRRSPPARPRAVPLTRVARPLILAGARTRSRSTR
jgi:hypothetical protein